MKVFTYDTSTDQVKDRHNNVICRPLSQSINCINTEDDLVLYLELMHDFNANKDVLLINGMMH